MALDRSKIIPDILDRIASGQSLVQAAKANSMSWSTFFDWIKEEEGLADKYARARELQAEYYADEIVRISDETEDPQKARLQVDARKWVASKLLPRKYGERIDVTSKDEKIQANTLHITREVIGGK